MRNAKARLHQSAKAITSILMGVILLLGGVSAPAVAQGTEYYVADGWVLLDPTATPLPTATPAPTGAESAAPAETPAQSVSPSPEPTPVPEGTLTAVADGIAFSVLPAADSPLQGASFAVQPLTDAAALAAAQAAYGARYAADGAAALLAPDAGLSGVLGSVAALIQVDPDDADAIAAAACSAIDSSSVFTNATSRYSVLSKW